MLTKLIYTLYTLQVIDFSAVAVVVVVVVVVVLALISNGEIDWTTVSHSIGYVID